MTCRRVQRNRSLRGREPRVPGLGNRKERNVDEIERAAVRIDRSAHVFFFARVLAMLFAAVRRETASTHSKHVDVLRIV